MTSLVAFRIKLPFDIYYVQIQEGDIIRKIRDYHQYIAHFHTVAFREGMRLIIT